MQTIELLAPPKIWNAVSPPLIMGQMPSMSERLSLVRDSLPVIVLTISASCVPMPISSALRFTLLSIRLSMTTN